MNGIWQLLLGLAAVSAVIARAMGGPSALFFLLCALGAAFTVWAIQRGVAVLRDPSVQGVRMEDARDALAYERDLAVMALKELEADAAAGKVDPGDVDTLRSSAEARALDLIARIRNEDRRWDLMARRVAVAALGWTAHESAFPKESVPPGDTCAACGGALSPDDRFCPSCGRRVEVAG